ncbi:MAG: hypothetical protein AB8E15_11520 [Bdellovibrionales bacterium]
MKFLGLVVLLSLVSSKIFAIQCVGTEPFWNATVNTEEVVFNAMALEEPVKMKITKLDGIVGFSTEHAAVYSNNNGPVAIITTESCNDGMSDDDYLKKAIIFTDFNTFMGCCTESK